MNASKTRTQNDIFMQPCHTFCFSLQPGCCQHTLPCMCAGELYAGDLFASFINNFVIQLCFSTTSHNYGNQLQSLIESREEAERRGGEEKKKVGFFFWIFPYGNCALLTIWRQPLFSQSMESLSSPWIKKTKNRKTYRQSAHKQTSTTSHHLPAACDADAVRRAAGGGRTREAAARLPRSPLQYASSPRSHSFSSISAHVRASPIPHRHTAGYFALASPPAPPTPVLQEMTSERRVRFGFWVNLVGSFAVFFFKNSYLMWAF